MKTDMYFILSSSCKLVNGAKRNVIIDYMRNCLFFISHEYFELIKKMDRCKLSEVSDTIEEDSKVFFDEFVRFIQDYEIGFFTSSPENFPRIDETYWEPDYLLLMDAIVEVDSTVYSRKRIEKLCHELTQTKCKDIQIRILSPFDITLLTEVVELLNHTYVNYIEVHGSYCETLDMKAVKNFLQEQPLVSHLYLYGSSYTDTINVLSERERHRPTSFGTIYLLNYPFDNGNCCGIINQKSFLFNGQSSHIRLKVRNGCLDKKVAIDRFGNIKNCPSMKHDYGNIETVSLQDLLQQKAFQRLGLICKDQIDTCRVCEFRYNCTDCRAFLQDPDNIYSKPLKCSYNPYTAVWEDEHV